jgi:hypothetical protein
MEEQPRRMETEEMKLPRDKEWRIVNLIKMGTTNVNIIVKNCPNKWAEQL